MHYSSSLAATIDAKHEIPSGCEVCDTECSCAHVTGLVTFAMWQLESEIRAATIQAVEQLHQALVALGHHLHVIELDWLLWQLGEDRKDALKPHHRTLTIYY